ncbi:MAG: dATP pyrophosphohydrolase [Stagnimonas sp.]|nr:dATP pyrophosphohydrolase [Stagnimonas sp.]
MTTPLQLLKVDNPRLLSRFIRLPARLHAKDPNWVTPLELEREEAFSPKKNPLFQTTEVQFWLALRDGRDVGRISAQVERRAAPGNETTGHFGLIAAEDDAEVFAALFATAEAWLRERGMTQALGPFNLSINEETGLLVQGFETPPMLLMGHDLPYVGPRIEALGYRKAKDVHAYFNNMMVPLPETLAGVLKRPLPKKFRLRHLSFKQYRKDIEDLTSIFNEAWCDNWHFSPLTPADTDHLAKAMRPILDEKLVWFVDVDGEPVAFGVTLPNINEALHGLDGKLLPFGWAKLLWRLKVKGVKSCRVPLMGVRRKYATGFSNALLPFLIINAMREQALLKGFETVELSWILEDNLPMRRICEQMGAVAYKTYRLYGKALA